YNVIWLVGGLIFDCFVRGFRTDTCEFEIPKGLISRAYRAEFLRDGYELQEREMARKFIRADDRVLEVGGCLGIVSCVANKLLRDKVRHVVVEGNPFCISAICRNRDINHCGFLVENCAVSSERAVTFYLQPDCILGGSVMDGGARGRNRLSARVPDRTLAELDARYGPFSTSVTDIEGADLDALEGAMEILKGYRLVIIEFHEGAIGAENVDRCREWLRHAGLRLQERAGNVEALQRN
ncbi:MAG: FkbM family methyltransferase, partial [Limisphaerales bacterium]